ncbi:MAG: hypothetical protein ABFR36_06235 [Acidobacteriota bacterium]
MKKIIYFLMLILLIIFSWLHKEPGKSSTSEQEKSSQVRMIN